MAKTGGDKSRFRYDCESSEQSFEKHLEMMKRFRRSHARMPSIDSKAVKKANWQSFVAIKKENQSENPQN